MMKLSQVIGVSVVAFCATGCTADDGHESIAVDANELGVARLEVKRFVEHDERVFELRGLNGAGEQIAMVGLRIGAMSALAEILPPTITDQGSEITLVSGDKTTQYATRDVSFFQLEAHDAVMQDFVGIAQVESVLLGANIRFDAPPIAPAAGEEIALNATSCPASYMLTTPTARECCWGSNNGLAQFQPRTHIVNQDNRIAKRLLNTNGGTACRASDGVSSCTGFACVYGPNGFATPVIQMPTAGNPYPYIGEGLSNDDTFTYCTTYYTAVDLTNYWPDVTGTFPRGRGCCNGVAVTNDYDWCCNGVPSMTDTGGCVETGANPAGGPGGYWDY